jgi:hypothetical protein
MSRHSPCRCHGAGFGRSNFNFSIVWADQFHVIPICAVHYDGDRDAVRVGQHAAFNAGFASIGRIGAVFIPLNGEFVIAPSTVSEVRSIPLSASTAKRRSAKTSRRPRYCSTSGTLDARNCWNGSRSRLVHFIDTPYAIQTVSHSSQRGHSFSGYDHQADAAYVALQKWLQPVLNPIWQAIAIVSHQQARDRSS